MANQSTGISEGGSGEGFCSTKMAPVKPLKPTARKRKLVFDDDPSTATRHAQTQAQWSAYNPPAGAGGMVSQNYLGPPAGTGGTVSHNYFGSPAAGVMSSHNYFSPPAAAGVMGSDHININNGSVGWFSPPYTQISIPPPMEEAAAAYVNTPPRVPPPIEEATAYVTTPAAYVNTPPRVPPPIEEATAYVNTPPRHASQHEYVGNESSVGLSCLNIPEEVYALYLSARANQPFNAGLVRNNDNLMCGHYQHNPSNVNSNVLYSFYANGWNNPTYPYLSFPAYPNEIPVQHLQNTDISNKSQTQTHTLLSLPSTDASLAPVTPEKNIQNEQKSSSSADANLDADVSLDGKVVAHEQQRDPLHLRLSTDAKDTKIHQGQSLPPLVDTSAFAFQSPPMSNDHQLAAEGEIDGLDFDLNKTPPSKAKKKKHRPKVIREGSSARKSKAKNLQQPIAERNSEGDKILFDNPCLSEDTILDKETSLKLQNKSVQADQLVDGSPRACEEEPASFSKELPHPQKEEIAQETEKSQVLQQHIQSVGPTTVTAELSKVQTTLMPSPQEEGDLFMNSNNKISNTVDNLTQSPSIVSSVRRKSVRENIKTLARKRDQLVTKEKCINSPAEPKAITSQSFLSNALPDKFMKQRRKKRQTRKLASITSDISCKVSTIADPEFRVGDQANTTIVACQSLNGHNNSYCGVPCSYWGTHIQKMHHLPQNAHWIGFNDSIQDSQSSNNLLEPGNSSPYLQASFSLMDAMETIIQRFKYLQIDEKHQHNTNQGLEMVPSNTNSELVPYVGNHAMVPYEGPFNPLKKKKPRPRVDLDIETSIAWRVLMGKASDEDKQAAADEDREIRWEEERSIFKGRAESFIARMHLVQGDRRFSQWKGSVVDSVVGAFLTQNVSDHLSSSAFISVASRFPPVEKNEGTPCDSNDLGESEMEVNTLAYEVSQPEQNAGQLLPEQIPGHSPVSPGMDELGEENLNENANSGESHASNLLGDKSNFLQITNSSDVSINEYDCQKTTYNHRHFISADRIGDSNVWEKFLQDQCLLDANLQMTMTNRPTDSTNQCADRFGSSSASNSDTGEQINEVCWKGTQSFPEPQSFTQLLKNVENNKLWPLNVTGRSSQTSSYDDTTSTLVQFPLAQYENREENEFGGRNFTHSESCGSDWIVNQNSPSRAGASEYSQNQENGVIPDVTTPPLLERPQAQTILNLEPQTVGLGKDKTGNIAQDRGASSEDLKNCVTGQNISGISEEGMKLLQVEGAALPIEDHMIDFLGRGSENNCTKVSCTQDSSLTEASINAAATLWSLAQGNSNLHPECLDQPQDQATEASELAQSSTQEDHHKSGNLGLEVPKSSSKDGKSKAPKIYTRKITGIARANIEMTQKNNKPMIDWESMRKKAPIFQKRERDPDTKDAINWEAVRCADVKDIAETIRERGMNNILAGRIKAFLEELHKKQGGIDLEWLKDIPPDDSKNFLLSIRGLGLKSVECIRLLALQHLAFPVDTNVGRICVRLGWVPLQPLPESVQLHLLELYPVLESIQKYLWPRLCKLDQRTLYELHYQMITFGKVFCTKSRPNCNACPMRCDCKHFASAFTSARLLLTSTKESSSVENPLLTLPCQENRNAPGIPLALPTIQQNVDIEKPAEVLPLQFLESNPQDHKCEPIIEEPATPEPEFIESSDSIVEECAYTDPDEIPVIKLNFDQLALHLQRVYEDNMQDLEDTNSGLISKALVTLSPEAASIPIPKLKNVSRLRTEHRVYELPDDHPLLRGLEAREPDDPCSYLLAIWTPGETSDSTGAPEQCCSTQASNSHPCDQESCTSCVKQNIINETTVKGTLLIPCRTAMRGSFPLNGTYFQVNEVFADHETSLNPVEVPRSWIWHLIRRTVYFGTSIPTIFRGLTTEAIQHCFWKGFVCVRGFDRTVRAPRPLVARLHFPASKQIKPRKRQTREKTVKRV